MLYSWTPERRATRAHLRHFIRQAVEQKQWAAGIGPEWVANASGMSLEMLESRRALSVHALARKSLEYARYRAFMRGAYAGYPGDRPARDLWQSLENKDS